MFKDPSKSGDPEFMSKQRSSKWEGLLSDVLFGAQRLTGYSTPNTAGDYPKNPYSGKEFENLFK